MKEEKEIPRLSTHKDTKSQLKEDNTAPRYQMTNMAVEIQWNIINFTLIKTIKLKT